MMIGVLLKMLIFCFEVACNSVIEGLLKIGFYCY